MKGFLSGLSTIPVHMQGGSISKLRILCTEGEKCIRDKKKDNRQLMQPAAGDCPRCERLPWRLCLIAKESRPSVFFLSFSFYIPPRPALLPTALQEKRSDPAEFLNQQIRTGTAERNDADETHNHTTSPLWRDRFMSHLMVGPGKMLVRTLKCTREKGKTFCQAGHEHLSSFAYCCILKRKGKGKKKENKKIRK